VLEALLHTGLGSIIAKMYKPDLVHFHATGPSFFVVFSKFLGCKVVATHHGFDYERDKWSGFAKDFIKQGERNLCKSHGVITISNHIADSIKTRLQCNSTIIPNGVDIIKPPENEHYCKKWNVQKGKYFLFAGRFVPEKCIDDLIEAYSRLKTDWKLVIAGDTDHEDIYSRKVKALGKSTPGVVLTGYIRGEELQSVFAHAGSFVLPSSHEGLPIALLEALSYGLPCIASDIPANKAVNHASIKYFPTHDINSLQDLMASVSAGNHKINSKELISFIDKNYNWDSIAEKTFNFYQEILKK
jgi:glycosyltransferase involved in cell wall biosynthesis